MWQNVFTCKHKLNPVVSYLELDVSFLEFSMLSVMFLSTERHHVIRFRTIASILYIDYILIAVFCDNFFRCEEQDFQLSSTDKIKHKIMALH